MTNKNTIIDNIEFIDLSSDEDVPKVYLLVDDDLAETIGTFGSLDSVKAGIAEAVEKSRRPAQLWGQIYDLDRLIG